MEIKKFVRGEDIGEYYKQFSLILDKYLPDSGEGMTRATQIVTAVNKLMYGWYCNGDVYDSTGWLVAGYNDISSYANWLQKYVAEKDSLLWEVVRCKDDEDYEELLAEICATYLVPKFLEEQNERCSIGSIYKCDGPFKVNLREEW